MNPPVVDLVPAKPGTYHYLHASKTVEKRATEFGGKYAWPTKEKALMSDLMEALFPIIFLDDSKFLVIGLNSCIEGAFGVTDGAFGKVGADQLVRLSKILSRAGSRRVLILVHHHVGIPMRIKQKFGRKLKFLQLVDARKLLDALEPYHATIFHGHKHIAYSAKFGNTTIISAGSACYGDILDNSQSAVIYSIPEVGQIRIVDAKHIKVA
ncbi:metallophosphoesterase family protein [Sinorhizobium fredii]|uniref:metallophosphoesterase family protein n=1 Tax=Rhizobium fredii TaxID=380 RepID=UPI003511C972